MNDAQHVQGRLPKQDPPAVAAISDRAVLDAERSALAIHQDPSLVRPHPSSKIGRGLEWVRPSDLIAAHSARLAGRGLNLQTDLAARVRHLPSQARITSRQHRLPARHSAQDGNMFETFNVFETSATHRQSVQSRTTGIGFR